jgi:hypothetical protein
MSQPNWANLVRQGRAKAVGLPWSDAEATARFTLGIPADFVRAGVLTKEAYDKAVQNEQVPVEQAPIVLSAPKEKSKGKGKK